MEKVRLTEDSLLEYECEDKIMDNKCTERSVGSIHLSYCCLKLVSTLYQDIIDMADVGIHYSTDCGVNYRLVFYLIVLVGLLTSQYS